MCALLLPRDPRFLTILLPRCLSLPLFDPPRSALAFAVSTRGSDRHYLHRGAATRRRGPILPKPRSRDDLDPPDPHSAPIWVQPCTYDGCRHPDQH